MRSPKQPETIIDYIPVFLEYCEVEKGLVLTTIKNYRHFLNKFKVNQLVALNKNDVEFRPKKLEIKIFNKKKTYPRTISLSENAAYWIKKYIEKRIDQDPALFINLRRDPSRLTIRSVLSDPSKESLRNIL